MKYPLILLSILWTSVLLAQRSDSKIIESFQSEILDENRAIWIHIPSGLQPGERCPVVYVLDGEANFDTVLDILHDIGEDNSAALSMVVVGVGNIWQRYRDYTPTHITSSLYVDNQTAVTTGGGPKFISFLENELIPYIHTKYPVSSTRIMVGHSLGGLIAMEMLMNHRNMFTHYIAIDPSMWWDEQKPLTDAKSVFKNEDFTDYSLYLAIANVSEKNMDAIQIRADESEKTELTRPTLMLADYLTDNKQSGLAFEYRFYKDHDHMSVFCPGVYDGVKFILKLL